MSDPLLYTLVALNLSVSLCTLYVVLRKKGSVTMAKLDFSKLIDDVHAIGDAKDAVVAFIAGLQAQIAAMDPSDGQAIIDQLHAQLEADKVAFSAAIVANTPAAPSPPALETPAP